MSASPDPTQQIINQANEEEVSFRFCRECSNMLYPKEDRENSRLMFACRTCSFSEPAPSHCVWRNQLSNTVSETAGVTTDVGQDPTVSDHDPSVHQFCLFCGSFLVEDQGGEEIVHSEEKTVLNQTFGISQSWDICDMFDEEEEEKEEEGGSHGQHQQGDIKPRL